MNTKELTGFSEVNFICDSCGKSFQQEVAYSVAQNWEEFDNTNTYCLNCVERGEKKQTSRKKTKDFGTPPTETSENLRSLEIDKRTLRKTNRIHQFNTSVSKEWMEKLKTISYEERLKYVEVLEKALECYEKHRK
jgi:hypothetical protein